VKKENMENGNKKKRPGGLRYQITLSDKDKDIFDRTVDFMAERYNLVAPRRGWCVARALQEWLEIQEKKNKE